MFCYLAVLEEYQRLLKEAKARRMIGREHSGDLESDSTEGANSTDKRDIRASDAEREKEKEREIEQIEREEGISKMIARQNSNTIISDSPTSPSAPNGTTSLTELPLPGTPSLLPGADGSSSPTSQGSTPPNPPPENPNI